jgi:hypothetical protein
MEAVNAIDVLMDRARGLSPVDGFDYDPVPNLSLVCPRALPATLHPAEPQLDRSLHAQTLQR